MSIEKRLENIKEDLDFFDEEIIKNLIHKIEVEISYLKIEVKNHLVLL